MAKNQSTEDYLKGIYKLEEEKPDKAVSTSSIARYLKIEDGSVTGMLKKLSRKKFIDYTPYRGVSLTPPGRRLALQIIRRHRLLELFLVQYLGYRWHEIHDEAERLEHATSDEFIQRLEKLLGHPKVDPHGDPIPTEHGTIASETGISLADCKAGDVVRLLRVVDNPAILRHITSLHLSIGKKVTVKRKLSLDGSLTIKNGSKVHFISEQVARAIYIRVL